MNITWYGKSCFKITLQSDKKSKQWTTILINPLNEKDGLKMPKTETDILLKTHIYEENVSDSSKKIPFIIDSPGEYEVKNIFIRGVESFHDENNGKDRGNNTVYTISAEDINICHLGNFGEKELSSKQLKEIGDIDILFVPVGGDDVIDAKGAAKVVSQIEPRIVIPMQYKIPGLKSNYDELGSFLKAIGEKGAEQQEKLSLQVKDLPSDDMKVVPLSSQSKKSQ